jgi:hypothetical protein
MVRGYDVVFVGAFGMPGDGRVEAAVGEQALEEARHRPRVVVGAREIAHAEAVRFELLVARVALQIDLRARAGEVDERARAGREPEPDEADLRQHRLAVALRRMARGDVADLVRHHAG